MSDSKLDHERDEAIGRLRELAKQLPYERPEPARVDAVRSALLVAATTPEEPRRSRWPLAGGAFAFGAVAAAAVVLLVVQRGPAPSPSTPPEHRSSIEASTAADFDRQITHTATGIDEVVRIRGGRVSLSVGALAAGERVRIVTGNAEIEGIGRYEVAVTADQIRAVTVAEGTATIRVVGHQAVFLAAGQTWTAPVITADVQPARPVAGPDEASSGPRVREKVQAHPDDVARGEAPLPAAIARAEAPLPAAIARGEAPLPAATESTSTETTPTTPATPTTQETPPATQATPRGVPTIPPIKTSLEQHFATGMQLFKAGKAAEAARELGVAADSGSDDPLATDARYFQALAFTKAGRKTEAEGALVAFLDHAPHSVRRGRAAVLLGRLIAERGDRASAKAWFESATHDADPAVVSAAKAGLASVAP
jgi:TolA-binding protein